MLHSVMELIDLDKADRAESVREELARLVAGRWLTQTEADSVEPEMVAAFYASELGRAARNAPDLRREFKFSIFAPASRVFPQAPEQERVMMQGVVDCCFTSPEGLTVVDFKTDRVSAKDVAKHSERYRSQMDSYTWALERIFGTKAVKRVLWYFRLGQGFSL